MRRHVVVIACLTAVPVVIQSVVLSPAELSVLEGEDGCTASERNREVCSLSLLQTRMTRRNTEPPNGVDDVWYGGFVDDVAVNLKDLAQKTSSEIKKTAEASRKASSAIAKMNESVAALFAIQSAAESENGELNFAPDSSDFAINKIVKEIKFDVDFTADGIKKKLQASSDASDAIRKMSEAVVTMDALNNADHVDNVAIIDSEDHSIALQSWKPHSNVTGETNANFEDKTGVATSVVGVKAAGAVDDIVRRADRIADTLKKVEEAAETNHHDHSTKLDHASEQTLQVLDDTVGKIKRKADKIAEKLKKAEVMKEKTSATFETRGMGGGHASKHEMRDHSKPGASRRHDLSSNTSFDAQADHAEFEDRSGSNSNLSKHSQKEGKFNKLSSRSREEHDGGIGRHSWSKSLEDWARSSEESRKHSNFKLADDKKKHSRSSRRTAQISHETTNKKKRAHGESSTSVAHSHSEVKNHHQDSEHLSHNDADSSISVRRSSGESSTHRHNSEKQSDTSDGFTTRDHAVISVKMEEMAEDDLGDELCDPGRVVDFSAARLVHSNLGGAGPDEGTESIVYEGVSAIDGAEVNLVITALSSYTPFNPLKNGLAGPFGRVNLQVETKVDLLFSFVYSTNDKPALMEPFYFTFVDLDNGMAHLSAEKITVKGFDSYKLSTDTEVLFKAQGADAAMFSSSWRGGKLDNPSNPMSMNKLERDRTVTAVFNNVTSFEVTFEESGYANVQGRNFLFSGISDLVCSREQKCALYECPVGFHLRQTADFLVCGGRKCTRSDRDICCFPLTH